MKDWGTKPLGLLAVYAIVFVSVQVGNQNHLVLADILQVTWLSFFVLILLSMPDWSGHGSARPERIRSDDDEWPRAWDGD